MTTLVQFISAVDWVLYFLAGVGIIFAIRGFAKARQSRRIAVFGLERDAAFQAQRRAFNTILFMFVLIAVVYVLSNIVEPNLAIMEDIEEPTPTPLVFVSPIPTATQALLLFSTITPTPALAPSDLEGMALPGSDVEDGCTVDGQAITRPEPGDTVSGTVQVYGQVNFIHFVNYRFELMGPGTNNNWVVLGIPYTSLVSQYDAFLGTWDSTSLPPGNYTLRLVIHLSDQTGEFIFPYAPCDVPIIIGGR